MTSSKISRALQPLRALAGKLPRPIRRHIGRAVRLVAWAMAFQFNRIRHFLHYDSALPVWLAASIPVSGVDPLAYDQWIKACDTLGDDDRQLIHAHIAAMKYRPLISVVVSDGEFGDSADSVRRQLYPEWEIRTASEALGAFVTVLGRCDQLSETALYEVAALLDAHPDTDIIFTDEDRLDDRRGTRHAPYFKPDWDADLILGQDFVGCTGFYRRDLLTRVGGLGKLDAQGRPDHGLILRASAATNSDRIRHIPVVLYHARRRDDEPAPADVGAALRAHVATLPGGVGARVLTHEMARYWHRVQWPLPDPLPKVTIIIPTRDQAALLARCVAGVLHRTDYPDLEVVLVDNGSTAPDALALLHDLASDRRVRVLRDDGPFNFSALNNRAAGAATGDVLVLMNNDIDVLEAGWLREMVSHAMRPHIGTVGAKLLYGNGRVQHAGVVLGVGHPMDGPPVAGHFGNGEPGTSLGMFGHSILTRTVCASTAACLAVRRDIFMAVGGLDADQLPVSFNDVDFCLRVRALGYRNVWTPYAELLHLESASRGDDLTGDNYARALRERQVMRDRWGTLLDNDPYFSTNFSRADHTYRLQIPARRIPPWRNSPTAR